MDSPKGGWEIHAKLITSAAVQLGITLPVISLFMAHISSTCDMVQLPSQYIGQSNSSYSSHPCLVCLLDLKARIHVAYIHSYVSFTLCFSSIWSQKQLLGNPILKLWRSISSKDQHSMWVTATSFLLLLPSIIWTPSIRVACIHAYVSFLFCFSSIWRQKQLLLSLLFIAGCLDAQYCSCG